MIEATMAWESKVIRLFIRNSYQRLAKIEYPEFIADLRRKRIYRTLPQRICSVLFVCKGNVCRSPLAAAYFTARLREQGRFIEVRSAGLETTAGNEAHPLAGIVAQHHNLSLQEHMTTVLNHELVTYADLILVMESMHCSTLLHTHPKAGGKVFQLGYFNNTLSTEIADPYSGTMADFETCYQAIRGSCDHLLKYLLKSMSANYVR